MIIFGRVKKRTKAREMKKVSLEWTSKETSFRAFVHTQKSPFHE